MKKLIAALLLLIISASIRAQQHKLTKLWQTDSVIAIPESVLFDKEGDLLFVSQMGNNPNDKDGIGGIALMGTEGKLIDLNWITGLNSPKGLAKFGNKLYVADLTEVVLIDIKNTRVDQRIPIDSAVFLNDLTVDNEGIVYVSDSRTKRIHKIERGVPSLMFNNIAGVNGLKAIGDDLYIAGGKTFYKAGKDKQLVKLAELPNGGDGIEPIGNGDFLFSSWRGNIYYVYADGRNELLLDTSSEKINTADIGYDPVKRIVYVPTFWKKSVIAYKLD